MSDRRTFTLPGGPRGLACPDCGCTHLPVYYTRPAAGGVVRVRRCRHCGRHVQTRERLAGEPAAKAA